MADYFGLPLGPFVFNHLRRLHLVSTEIKKESEQEKPRISAPTLTTTFAFNIS